MKIKLKRALAGLLALVMAFTAIGWGNLTTQAASESANLMFWYASVTDSGEVSELKAGYNHGKVLYAVIDGSAAYCMNFGLSADGGQLMYSYEEADTDLTEEQEKLLAYCMYFGYATDSAEAPDNTEAGEYIATQSMVWIIVKGIFGTGSADSAASKLCATAPNPDSSYEYYEKLRDNITASYYATRPSFSSKTASDATTYLLEWSDTNQRYETTLTDSNGVIADYNVSLSGYSVSRSGNKLTIYTDTVNTSVTTATLTSTAGVVETTSSCVFWLTGSSGYQEFVSEQPTAEAIKAYFKVKTESVGYGKIIKTDAGTGAAVSGAVYGIYSDSSCTDLIEKLTTDSDGCAKSGALTAGTYYVKEISAPKGYVSSDKVHTLKVTAGQTTTLDLTDTEQLGAITIYKEGEVLSGWDGSDFTYETQKLSGATFKVTAGADIYRADGTKVYSKGDTVAENIVTGSDGAAVVSDLYLGTYVVTETKSIEGYAINTTGTTVKLVYAGDTVSVQMEETTITNSRQKVDVTVTKEDADTGNALSGGEYTLYAAEDIQNYAGKTIVTAGTALETVTTGSAGTASFDVDLPVGWSYYVSETKAPDGYVRNSDDVYEFTFNALSETKTTASFSHTFENDHVTAKILLYKTDADTGEAVPQGDATLEGAVYGLYAREDIVHPDGVTGVLYEADELVATLTTDEGGYAEISGLYLGEYYVKEITPPEGYTLDEEEHDVTCDYEGDLVSEVKRTVESADKVIKQAFSLIKVSDDGDNSEATLLEGAGFTVYLKSSLPVNEDGTYDYDNAEPVVIGENGETTLYTDETGYLVTIPLPYGTYVVVETVTPHNMLTITPFEVSITESSSEPQTWRVFLDREFTAKLCIVKKDSDTGKSVLKADTEFRIYCLDTEEYVTMYTTYPSKVEHTSFYTDEDGDLILPETLEIGNYRIEEVTAPDGYVLNENYYTVSVDTNTAYYVDADTSEAIITVAYEDAPVTGSLTVEKRGEILKGYSTTEDFIYEEAGLEGATFAVYAAEDIYTADCQTDADGNRTKYYSEGDLVGTIVTGADGTGTLVGLPLGTYRVVEVEAPSGYVLNAEEQYVTFAYAGQDTPVVYGSLTFENDRQTVSMQLVKKDAETGATIAGAVFGLFAAEDITDVYGTVLIEAGTLLERAVSDEYGVVAFTKDYPFGTYEAKELAAPSGYVSSEETFLFETAYQGQDVVTAEYKSEYLNTPTTFEITKNDITSGAELSGATLTVLDSGGNIVDTWTSTAGEAHVIQRLTVGETYTLREEFAPYGYLQTTDVEFVVLDTADVQTVVMQDEVPTGTIIVNKDGEVVSDITLTKGHWYDFIFNFFRKSLAGVEFEVYAAEDIVSPDGLDTVYYTADELVATIVTDENGYAVIDGLPLGSYYLVETKTLDGYVLDSIPIFVNLSYVDQYTEIVYSGMSITNERQKVRITVTKTDADTGEALSGAVFGLFVKEDILNDDGKVVVAAGTQVERGVTGEDGTLTFESDLPLGLYYVQELRAPEGYVLSDEIYDIDASYQGDDVEVIEFEAECSNEPIRVQITKTDITGEEELDGAELSIIDSDGNVVETWTSVAGEPHLIERLPAGEYTLREVTSPYGYRIANDVTFTVEETAEIQTVSMKDEYVTGKIVIEKTDANTGAVIKGAEFEILDADGNVIETLVTDENGYAESSELPIAVYADGAYASDIVYTVLETAAASGYEIDETEHEVTFSYEGEAPDTVTVTLALTNQPLNIDVPKTGDVIGPWAAACAAAVAGIVILLLAGRRKKCRRSGAK